MQMQLNIDFFGGESWEGCRWMVSLCKLILDGSEDLLKHLTSIVSTYCESSARYTQTKHSLPSRKPMVQRGCHCYYLQGPGMQPKE